MNAKRLGNTIFNDNDPLDDLRPSKSKKFISLPEEARVEPEKVIDLPLPAHVEVAPPVAEPVITEAVPETDDDLVASAEPEAPKAKRLAKADEQGKSPRKVRFSANISISTKERADNAAYWVPGLNLSSLTEMALEREVRKLEKEFNNGETFKPAGTLKFGRPRS
jgi:hypothetical protein